MRPLRENATSTRCAWIRTPLLQDSTRNVDLWGTEANKESQHSGSRFSSQALAYTREMLTPHVRCDYFYEHLFESFWSPGGTDRASARSTQLLVPKPRFFTRLACIPSQAVCCMRGPQPLLGLKAISHGDYHSGKPVGRHPGQTQQVTS